MIWAGGLPLNYRIDVKLNEYETHSTRILPLNFKYNGMKSIAFRFYDSECQKIFTHPQGNHNRCIPPAVDLQF
ncbi:hypothetical protein T07_5116 [Trichinella nelsoni]|uniref:Uncharacterized protein n=1 Tax=Trichinella nelsoni TaxID=6336 RepID=A0A0V0RPY0_9BILA|nr:hypothetical protein T07_5116 [Trichinella nelsoni]